ncbi:hypothetical protein PG995_002689 [Apiospora arundinis]
MLVPLLLTLPLGIMGLAMPPKETTTPAAAGLEAREAPPKIEVMTMTCLMPGDDDTSSSSFSTDSWPPDSWTSSWSPYWPTTTRSWSWSTSSSSSSSSSTDDCWYWGDCPSTYYTSTSSAPAAQTCPWWDEDCSSSAASSSSSFGGFGTTMTTSSSTSDWWPDPWTTVTDSWDTTFVTATSKPSSASHRHSSASSSSSSTFDESDAPSIVPLPTSLRHQPIPPMIEPLSPRKRAPPAPSTPPTAPASGFFFGLFRNPFGGDSSNIHDRVKGVNAVEKISTETIVIGVSTDGTPIYTSTEWGSDSSSSSSSGSGSSSSFWAAGGPSSSSSSTTTSQPDVITPAPQSVTVSSSSTLRCDDEFCSDGSSWCVYWAGITSWDASKGPVPGEKATTIGTC